jgi:glucose 1-dehydrogenase
MNTLRALVTGATGGIGRAIGLALAQQSQREGRELRIAAAASREGPALQAVVEEWNAAGARAVGLAADLTDPASCASLVERARAACGGLSLLVSNAGASVRGDLADLPVAQWDATFALNVRATWLLAQAARPALAQSRGSIVAIASMSGLHPHPGYGAYSPAKAALVMLCRQLAQEWAAEGIRANAVCPGMIRTPLTEAVYQDEDVAARRAALVPLARIGRGEDVAAAVAYLASAGASYVTGQQLVVDGGVADHMLAMIPGRAARPAA